MKTYKYIAIFLCLFGYLEVNAECPGELGGISGQGIVNGNDSQNYDTYNWLYKDFNSVASHPNKADPGGEHICEYGIQVSGRDGLEFDSAYYKQEHYSDNKELSLRFILSTENLIQSFNEGDEIIFYIFKAMDKFNNNRKLFKILLVKDSVLAGWKIKLQWFSFASSELVVQELFFDESDSFIDFNFYMNSSDYYSDNLTDLFEYQKIQAGVMIKKGSGNNPKPLFFLSPFTYEMYSDAEYGTSFLGYINANNNSLILGDEIRIISPANFD